MTQPDLTYETAARANGAVRIAGVDEVGRGPLAGHDVYLLYGANGSGVSFHEHAASMLVVHTGAKRWVLLPPGPPVPRHHDPDGIASFLERPTAGVSPHSRDLICAPPRDDVFYGRAGGDEGTAGLT